MKRESKNSLRFPENAGAHPVDKSIRLSNAAARAVGQVPSMLIGFWEAAQQPGRRNTLAET